MKGFEEAFKEVRNLDVTDPEGLLKGFNFHDVGGKLWALLARQWALKCEDAMGVYRVPMVAITGPRSSGKTELARRISEGVSAQSVIGEIRKRDLGSAAMHRPATLVADMMCGDEDMRRGEVGKLGFPEVAGFISAAEWSFRRYGERERTTNYLRTMIIVTGVELVLPRDLGTRAVVIHLGARNTKT